MSTRYVIRESRTERRGGRKYTANKPYIRVVSRLAPVPADYSDVIPPFNPFKLYANSKPVGTGEDELEPSSRSDVQVKVLELLGGTLPSEDGQVMEASEVMELVEKALEPERPIVAGRIGEDVDGGRRQDRSGHSDHAGQERARRGER